MTESALLEVRNLVKHFPIRGGLLQREVGAVRAVDGVSFAIARGETLGLVGESGCGKSTIARVIARLVDATSGDVRFDGRDALELSGADLKALRRHVQIVFQDPQSSLNPRMTVGAIVAEPLVVHNFGSRAARRARVREMLSTVGLSPEHENRYPHEFSGGQRQRIGIARALVLEPAFLICDEPVSALDVSIQAQILNLLTDLRDRLNLTYLFVAHDLAVVRHIADRVAVMYLGRIVELAPRAALYAHPRHPYTQALLAAVPVPDPVIERRRERMVLGGDIPNPAKPPAGCAFHPRCPRVGDVCRVARPELVRDPTGRSVACHFPD